MKGLVLAKHFYFECVQPIIATQLPNLINVHAVGLIGYGSDVIGNDDELSRDHEWGPRLVLFLNEADHSRFAEELDGALSSSLPLTFMGFPTRFQHSMHGFLIATTSGVGRHHIAITTPERFLELTIGYRSTPATDLDWLLIPEQRLLEFTSGEIYYDGLGQVTQLRKELAYFPEGVWKYRLSYTLESLGWELDLLSLCARRGDLLSMHLNVAVTIKRIMQLSFLLNQRYCPGYAKWLHREFAKLPLVANEIENLLQDAFIARDITTVMSYIEQSLDMIYRQLRNLSGMSALPGEIPRTDSRGVITIDTQTIARIVLSSIPGPLGQLAIHDAPYGAVDQWLTNEDLLLSPAHMKALANIYNVQSLERQRFDAIL